MTSSTSRPRPDAVHEKAPASVPLPPSAAAALELAVFTTDAWRTAAGTGTLAQQTRMEILVSAAEIAAPAIAAAASASETQGRTFPDVPFLTGVGQGTWHAIGRESLKYLRTGSADSVAFAECGELVRVAPKFGEYNRDSRPVTYRPCHLCAWTVAAAGGRAAMEAEADRLRPTSDTLPALDAVMADSFIAVNACRAVLAAAVAPSGHYNLEHGATLQMLTAIARHAPVLLVGEKCSEGGCSHRGPCRGIAACQACSLQDGEWAGEWAGHYRPECTIQAPCAVLTRLAESARSLRPSA
jgi:hypothetical protein